MCEGECEDVSECEGEGEYVSVRKKCEDKE